MNALITGGAGFIGSYLSEKLLDQGHRVICVDNFLTGQRQNITHLKKNDRFTLIEADVSLNDWHHRLPITNRRSLDVIFHLASPAGPNPKSPKSYHALPVETYLVNSIGTHHLVKLAHRHQAALLFSSTSEVYGDPEVHPQPEDYHGNVNPLAPRAIYDESKRLGETICSLWSRKFNLQTRIARIFNTYGPRMNPDDGRVIPVFILAALKNQPLTIYGDGKQTRSFCYIDDQVNGLLKLINSDLNADPINIGNAVEITIIDLAKLVIKLTASSSGLRYDRLPEGDPVRRCPDITKAREKLNWKPETSLEKGLKKTIDYFLNQ